MTVETKLQISCTRCSEFVICDIADNDDGTGTQVGSPKRPPGWTIVQHRHTGNAAHGGWKDLCPVCTGLLISFLYEDRASHE
jgi:hypothetical protein